MDRRSHTMRRVAYKLWIIPLALFGLQVFCWAVDRDPPHKFGSYVATPALPGGPVVLNINVKRDLERRCSVELIRQFFDREGTRFNIGMGGTQSYNAGTIAHTESRTPGRLILGFNLPTGAASGTGLLVTTANYTCNPLHTIWPIEFIMVQEVMVL